MSLNERGIDRLGVGVSDNRGDPDRLAERLGTRPAHDRNRRHAYRGAVAARALAPRGEGALLPRPTVGKGLERDLHSLAEAADRVVPRGETPEQVGSVDGA